MPAFSQHSQKQLPYIWEPDTLCKMLLFDSACQQSISCLSQMGYACLRFQWFFVVLLFTLTMCETEKKTGFEFEEFGNLKHLWCISVYLHACLSIHLSIYPSIHVPVHPFVCLSLLPDYTTNSKGWIFSTSVYVIRSYTARRPFNLEFAWILYCNMYPHGKFFSTWKYRLWISQVLNLRALLSNYKDSSHFREEGFYNLWLACFPMFKTTRRILKCENRKLRIAFS